jgi:photosystem II stability/assembly factor-like uncharacterized protein
MTRFDQVVQILNTAVGGVAAPVGFHGPFWRNVTRDQLVAKKVFGLPLIALGNGASSNLVKALKGEAPFGADLPNPPPDATFNRMPSGRAPVAAADIAFIQKWIDDGCPEGKVVAPPGPGPQLQWRKTNAPLAQRHDDIWFVDPKTGWAVNSDGDIIKTTDGGAHWDVQKSLPGVYLRCVGFANPSTGWVGTLTRSRRMFHTTDGGVNWDPVTNLPAKAPVNICGLSVVNDRVIYASGTNDPKNSPGVIKTTDGGANWTAIDMRPHASLLVDIFFIDEKHGWVVGGKANEPNPTVRDKVKPVVLETSDGGATWTNRLAGQEANFPFNEWGWKIQFLNKDVGFVSLENFAAGAILKSTNGGKTWTRQKVNDAQNNANLEGIGFIDEKRGWVGGWGPGGFTKGFTSATVDGGSNWRDANDVGLFLNRFRFFGSPVSLGYASGDGVYKYSAEPVVQPNLLAAATRTMDRRRLLPQGRMVSTGAMSEIPIDVPAGTKRLTLHAWDRFGVDVGVLLDEIRPKAGARIFLWDGHDANGNPTPAGAYIVRLTADDVVASSILARGQS